MDSLDKVIKDMEEEMKSLNIKLRIPSIRVLYKYLTRLKALREMSNDKQETK
jgi:hypothetical protein